MIPDHRLLKCVGQVKSSQAAFDLLEGPHGNELSSIQDRQSVTYLLGLFKTMGDQKHGFPQMLN